MDRAMGCPKCGENFLGKIRVSKKLKCLHTVCLQCLNQMQTADNKLRCPVCGYSQRVARGNCDMLPNDVLRCRRLANMRICSSSTSQGEMGRKEILQTRIDALRVEIHSWEQQLRGYSQERSRVDALANRAKERIQDAVERLVEKLRARGLQLCSRVDADVEPYKSEPFARIQAQIRSGVDVCGRAENVMREFEMRAHESEECAEAIRRLLGGAGMTLLERLDVELLDDSMVETIAIFGNVKAVGILQLELNVTDSAPSAPDIPSAPASAPPVDYTHCSGPRTIDPEPARATESADGRGAARCNGLCMPPCYECVMSSSRYAHARTHAQGSPAQTGSAQSSPAERIPVQRGLAQHAHAGPSRKDEPSSSLARSAAIPDYAVLSLFNVLSSTWPGPGPGGQSEMKDPQSVVARNQQLVVANTGAGVVQVAELNGRVVCEQRGLFRPRGVAVDCDADRVYVTENFRHVVHAFDYSTLEPRAKYGGDGMFNMPNQVAVDARHKILYVTDNTGVIVMSLVGKGEVIGRLSRIDDVTRGPWGVAVDKHVVVVTYPMDQRVVVYEKSDGVARDPGRALPGHFLEPRGVCIDEAGKMLVADRGGIKILSATSANLISKVTQRLLQPVAVSVSGGMLVAVDESDSRIKVYKATTNA